MGGGVEVMDNGVGWSSGIKGVVELRDNGGGRAEG